MIELRRVETEADADVFLALRSEIDPEHMTPRAAYLEHLRSPRRLDLLGVLDGVAVGTGFVGPHGDDLAGEGPEGWISVRVLRGPLLDRWQDAPKHRDDDDYNLRAVPRITVRILAQLGGHVVQ